MTSKMIDSDIIIRTLQNEIDERDGIIRSFACEKDRLESEIEYYYDFIRWMHLESLYNEFVSNAYKYEPEDGGFSYYTM